MDFYKIKERRPKKGLVEIYPDFKVCRSKDLMTRGRAFYAIWDEERGTWSKDEYTVQRLIDKELDDHANLMRAAFDCDEEIVVKYMSSYSSKSWSSFKNFVKDLPENYHELDNKIIFSTDAVSKKDYSSRRLTYPLEEGSIEAYDEIIGTLYSEEERAKIEWAIGSIVAGDSKDIQKFIVLYGDAGAGKSTILNIIQKLFEGYYTIFEAKALVSGNNAFSTEVFKDNPLVAIQHDGDLSKIEDNTKLNSIVSHEEIMINEKYKSGYCSKMNCFLFMATNKPVMITDAKSGIIRRLINVSPSGKKIPMNRYHILMGKIDYELGAIAKHCLDVYREMGKGYYDSYKPIDMMFRTDFFFNFVENSFDIFARDDSTTLARAYKMYKEYCDDSGITKRLPRYSFRDELKNYFDEFHERYYEGDDRLRSYYKGFHFYKFLRDDGSYKPEKEKEHLYSLVLDQTESIFDEKCYYCQAQYANESGTPYKKWDQVKTRLHDINTTYLHYVKVPKNHIVIDFDLKDENGIKSIEKNLEAASKFPSTYAEFSKSGQGVHLHYIYNGDVEKLSRVYDEGIEIKVFTGNSSLRRRLSKCNNVPIATINSGLPLKGEKVVNLEAVKSEKALRTLLKRNLNKEIHPGTKPSIDFIYKILEDAYAGGLKYDVTDMRPSILAFANNSTHQSAYCVKLVGKMKFKSDEPSSNDESGYSSDELIFFDVEVFPNLFVVVWKRKGGQPVKMINPTPDDIEELVKFKLVGFNCRRYDNHILYGRILGYSNEQLYDLSQRIINNSPNSKFGEAYNISYTDVYDFSSAKKSLKKFEIELGIHHQELGLKWDESVPEELWGKVAEYCINDVVATEAVFEARKADFIAREILADLAGMTVNDTTNSLTTRIIFGRERHPALVYTDLSETFEGYEFKDGKNMYRGEDVGFGGYIRSNPGSYGDVALLDIASLHPNSIRAMNCFGEYTKNFTDLVDARVAIKHGDYESARKMMDGRLAPYLDDESKAKDLAQALKIAINSVYGLTAASFDNPFRDIRNKNNIVALRGALFMKTLRDEVESQGFKIVAIKTDSIKIADATKSIIDFCMEFANKYGYTFEHEATYDKMCQINDADYIARYKDSTWCMEHYGYIPGDNQHHEGEWTATGAQFQQPYVFKTLFSKEPIEFKDLCETKTVSTALYLDFNEENEEEHNYHFVGKAGSFCPISPGKGGGILLREKDDKYYAATGSKGYRWKEAEVVSTLGLEDDIDRGYFNKMVDGAVEHISKYCDFEWFISEEPYDTLPWT